MRNWEFLETCARENRISSLVKFLDLLGKNIQYIGFLWILFYRIVLKEKVSLSFFINLFISSDMNFSEKLNKK